jgi:TRAP-type mannitol/chloroaromatic compound transport system permease small subunit
MNGDLTQIINTMTQVVLFAVPVALVLLMFFWNMSQLIFQSGNAEKMKEARARIFWSIVGMFVLFSLAGILVVLQRTFFEDTNQNVGTIPRPQEENPLLPGGGN